MQQLLGVDEPDFRVLLDDMFVEDAAPACGTGPPFGLASGNSARPAPKT
jgi:hypothetical protein